MAVVRPVDGFLCLGHRLIQQNGLLFRVFHFHLILMESIYEYKVSQSGVLTFNTSAANVPGTVSLALRIQVFRITRFVYGV